VEQGTGGNNFTFKSSGDYGTIDTGRWHHCAMIWVDGSSTEIMREGIHYDMSTCSCIKAPPKRETKIGLDWSVLAPPFLVSARNLVDTLPKDDDVSREYHIVSWISACISLNNHIPTKALIVIEKVIDLKVTCYD
jgi:hypothetical protein